MKGFSFNLFKCIKFILMICLLFNTNAYGQNRFDLVDNYVDKYIKNNNIPGFAYCIVKEGNVIWFNSYGKANIEKNLPMTIDKVMNIASISKTFTATAALQLWEKGLISLDDDINKYLDFKIRNPRYPEVPITIFQILTHTSSINDGASLYNSYSCGDPVVSLRNWIYSYFTPGEKYSNPNENFCEWQPGDKEKYSNVAFGLLGLIIEEVTKKPFHEYCKKNIFSPLEMKNTGWFLNEIDPLNHIVPYISDKYINDTNNSIPTRSLVREYPKRKSSALDVNCPLCLYSFPNYPDGLVRTSVRELSFFLISVINKGRYKDSRILQESTVKKMFTLQIDDNKSQGLCWHQIGFESLWGHPGEDPGVCTNMYFNPKTKIGVITFQNSNNGNSFEILKRLYLTAKSLDK